jgi:hypothetical protein
VFALRKKVKQGRRTLLHKSVRLALGWVRRLTLLGVLMWRLVRAPVEATDWPRSDDQASNSVRWLWNLSV